MTCSKCGTVAARPGPFCSSCGTSLVAGGVMPPMPPPPIITKTSGLAITGFVLSFVCGVLGLIFSIIGYNECKKSKGRITGEGFALAGIVISIVSVVCAVLMWWLILRVGSAIDGVIDESSPRMTLRSMVRRAEQYQIEHGQYPTGDFAPTHACCNERRERCNPDWNAPQWRAIGFESTDGWSSDRYRFGYRSTPTKFEAIAVGDSDCDGDEVTLTLVHSADGESPESIQRTGDD